MERIMVGEIKSVSYEEGPSGRFIRIRIKGGKDLERSLVRTVKEGG